MPTCLVGYTCLSPVADFTTLLIKYQLFKKIVTCHRFEPVALHLSVTFMDSQAAKIMQLQSFWGVMEKII